MAGDAAAERFEVLVNGSPRPRVETSARVRQVLDALRPGDGVKVVVRDGRVFDVIEDAREREEGR